MTRLDNKIILGLNRPLSFSRRPFLALAKRLGMREERLLAKIKEYQRNGLIRRFTVILNHRRVGFKTNVLLAWKVEPRKINQAAGIFSAQAFISHCYLRKSYPHWRYNIYTMLHAPDPKTCLRYIKLLLLKTGIKDFRILYTLKEFKKTRMDLGRVLG